MSSNSRARSAAVRSALWAAYGDALGFITEFADSRTVARRAGTKEVSTTVPWRRRVGGKFGALVDLPAGAISDDTQLRLATCRTILPDGSFDVEAFSKIELTIWPSYALGAGRGSKTAASHLARRDTTWASNFFDDRTVDYVRGGGNGAAMRIQPHVWAGGERPFDAILHDVLVNSLCTHGHPRGFMGAAFHAGCLYYTMREGRASGPSEWRSLVAHLEDAVPRLLRQNDTLRDLWVGQWEERNRTILERGTERVASELLQDISRLEALSASTPLATFRAAVEELELFDPAQRGSGTKCALLAALAAWVFAPDANRCVLVCANALGTDTDTVASMAGALVGALAAGDPPGEVQDVPYVTFEARRMAAIAERRPVPGFPVVDLLSWIPPRTQSDVVGVGHVGDVVVAGLGPAVPISASWELGGREEAQYTWLRLWFGQSVLAKQRLVPPVLPDWAVPSPSRSYIAPSSMQDGRFEGTEGPHSYRTIVREVLDHRYQYPQTSILPPSEVPHSAELRSLLVELGEAESMHELTDIVIRSGFDPRVVGEGFLKAVRETDAGIERASAYSAIIAKALMSRRR